MSLEIKEGNIVRGKVHFGEHTVMKPTHYLMFDSLCVDAEEFIRAIISLPKDRRTARDLTHYRGSAESSELKIPATTPFSGAIEWNPSSEWILQVNSIPFTVTNTRAFLDWFRYTSAPQWVDEVFGGIPSSRPFTLTSGEKQGFEDFREFLATLPQEAGYWNVYEAPFLLALKETNERFVRNYGRSSYPEGYKFPYWYPEWVKI